MALLERTVKGMLLAELVQGMPLTLRSMFRQKHTIHYPYE